MYHIHFIEIVSWVVLIKVKAWKILWNYDKLQLPPVYNATGENIQHHEYRSQTDRKCFRMLKEMYVTKEVYLLYVLVFCEV